MEFRGNYAFLSNMYEYPVDFNGYIYKCAEAAFQAQKCPERSAEFVNLNGVEAKRLGKTVHLRDDWEQNKVEIMANIIVNKFYPAHLRFALFSTGDTPLVEDNTWGDKFWGRCNGVGENMLGRVLMYVRNFYMNNPTIISGGALGADSVWGAYATPCNITVEHMIAYGQKRPSGYGNPQRAYEQSIGLNHYLSAYEHQFAVEYMCKLNAPISGQPAQQFFATTTPVKAGLHARNFYQVALTDRVLAVTGITNGVVSGGTATAVNLGIIMGKDVYVLNTNDGEWYHWESGWKLADKPQLAVRTACIGSRSIVNYPKCRGYIGEDKEQYLRTKMQAVFVK